MPLDPDLDLEDLSIRITQINSFSFYLNSFLCKVKILKFKFQN